MSDRVILAIDTSCDDTSAAIIRDGKVISSVVSSQLEMHTLFGGVVPEIAARNHQQYIWPVIEKTINEAEVSLKELTEIAVTFGPGLIGALLVGLNTAKAMAMALKIPVIPVNHMIGHIYSLFIESKPLEFPFCFLIVSGGHTQLGSASSHGVFRLHGETLDDAAGEAFDKVAKVMGLPYPGGPSVEKTASAGVVSVEFPRALDRKGNYDFSFSGLKTSVIQYIAKNPGYNPADIACSFQHAAVSILCKKTYQLARRHKIHHVAVCGGVAANGILRQTFTDEAERSSFRLTLPARKWCTDNAAMIGMAAWYCPDMYEYNHSLNGVAYLEFPQRNIK